MNRAVAVILGSVAVAALAALWAGVPLDWTTWSDPQSVAHRILFELRLPRLVFVFLCGASLAAVGCCYQILFHNPLAEPYLLGVSSAATLGIAVAETLGGIAATSLLSQAIGLACAAVVTLALGALVLSQVGQQTERVALFGLGINFVLSSALFLFLSYQSQQLGGGSLRWLFGQIPWVSAEQTGRFSLGALAILAALLLGARSLDALSFGDGVAKTLGVNPTRARVLFLALTSTLVAWMVSFTGSIGFVGLVVPHFTRLAFHPSSSRSLLAIGLPLGGAFLLFSDALSRAVLPPMEFPIGVITTLIGGPLFLVLLWRR
ncbi:iron ABC transporter permease [bacterium]|nr:iron ABC transporter permease [bacterium]